MSRTLEERFREVGAAWLAPPTPEFKCLVREAFRKAERLAADPDPRLQRKWTHRSGSVKHLVNPHRTEIEFERLLRAPEIATALERLFPGTSLYVSHSKISFKVSGLEQIWAPHQDSGYKPLRKLGQGATVAVFLEDCDVSNGTIEIFEGSHRRGRLKHEVIAVTGEREPQIRVVDLPASPALAVEGTAGTILFIDLNTVHQSGRNTRGGNRCVFIFEVETFRTYPLEQDGRDAVVINAGGRHSEKPAWLPVKRLTLFALERGLRLVAKPIVYLVLTWTRSRTVTLSADPAPARSSNRSSATG